MTKRILALTVIMLATATGFAIGDFDQVAQTKSGVSPSTFSQLRPVPVPTCDPGQIAFVVGPESTSVKVVLNDVEKHFLGQHGPQSFIPPGEVSHVCMFPGDSLVVIHL